MAAESIVETKILQCIDEGLDALGDSGKRAFYYHLKNDFDLRKEEIPRKPEIFCRGLTIMFGEEAAKLLRRWIIEKLKEDFRLKNPSTITFSKAVYLIKNKTREKSRHPSV